MIAPHLLPLLLVGRGNLLRNGDFSQELLYWAASGVASLAFSSGEAELTISGASAAISVEQPLTLTVGRRYSISLSMRLGTYVGNMGLVVDGSSFATWTPTGSTATYTGQFTAPSRSPTIRVGRSTAATGTVYFDNFVLTRA